MRVPKFREPEYINMPLPAKENRINRRSIREDVYAKLLNWIMEGVLRPGEKIVDKELAEHMGVSRTPVREALRRLEDKGLVESSANRWTRVSKIHAQEQEKVYPIIWTLEKLALSTAVKKMTDQDFAKMEKANNRLEKALEEDDPVAASKADADFHNVFIERSENHHLIQILEDLKIRIRRLEVNYFDGITYGKSSTEEHTALIAALKEGDVESAEDNIHSNWERSLKRFRAMENNGKENENGF